MIPRREQTMSELCLPFYYRGVKIGVMNFESPVIHAFDAECIRDDASRIKFFYAFFYAKNGEEPLEKYVVLRKNSFFYTLKSFLQYLYETLYERSDLQRLSRFSEREVNLHELENLVDNTKKNPEQSLDPYVDQISTLLTITRRYSSDNRDAGEGIYELFHKTRAERIDAYGRAGNLITVPKEVVMQSTYLDRHLPIKMQVSKRDPFKVKSGVAECLRDIYKNLLTNYFGHGDKENDRLEVKFQNNGTLIISQIYTNPPRSTKGKIWFVSPYECDGKVHSGLFIVGTLVRQLKGYVFRDYDDYNGLKRFDIHINLNEFKL